MTSKSKSAIKKFVRLERGVNDDSLKTAKMFVLEREWQIDIFALLDGRQPGLVLARKYGVTEACISKWRKRLNIQPIHHICPGCGKTAPMSRRVCRFCGEDMPKQRGT